MEFTVEAVYTQKDFIGFMRVYTGRDRHSRRMEAISRWTTRGAAIVMLVSALVNLLGAGYALTNGTALADLWKTMALQGALVVAGVLLLALPVSTLSGRRAWNRYEGQGMKITYRFGDNNFSETRQGNTIFMKYKGIRSIFEDPERYYLFVADNEAHIIVKSGFRQGDPEAFADFIEEKTGLELTVFDN